MRIWELHNDGDNYDSLTPVTWPSPQEIQTYDGRSKTDIWVSLKVKRLQSQKGLELSDLPGLFITVFSQKAVDILYPIIKDSVELLPLDYPEQQFYAINITDVMNVIDYDASEYMKFPDGKRIMMFDKYVFRNCDKLLQHDLFKIIDAPVGWPFVSDKFKEMVEENQLKGFVFKLVWDSEVE